MAAKLNKSRIRDTAILVIGSFLAILFSKQIFSHSDLAQHEAIEFIGYIFVSIAAVGRVYCTAFLGGFKNKDIIDYGPFSVCRNPLYCFSFIGVCGIALMSVNLLVIVIMPLGLLAIYLPLIKREEIYLLGKFGEPYAKYMKKTPRLFPNFKKYHAPVTIEMNTKTLLSALKDSIMWFLAFPLLEIVEMLHESGVIQPLFYLHF